MSDDDLPTGYRSGDLEAAARAAREDALAKAEAEREAARAEAEAGREMARAEAAERRAEEARLAEARSADAGAETPGADAGADAPPASTVIPDRVSPVDSGETRALGTSGVADAATSAAAMAVAGAAGTATATNDGLTEASPAPASADASSSSGSSESSADEHGSVLAFFRELPVLLAVAFLLAFLLRTFVVQVFYIPSGSMIPTLEVNDRIVVEKISYLFREPARGEVVVFEGDTPIRTLDDGFVAKVTRGAGQFLGLVPANARDFVKRVIGLPGDQIVIEDGVVFVNGVELPEPYAVEDLRDFGPFEVPEGKLFFLGDNRPSSADSRIPSALGYVDMDQVVGRAMVVVWPFEHYDGIGTPSYPDAPQR